VPNLYMWGIQHFLSGTSKSAGSCIKKRLQAICGSYSTYA
jgi:hypothetical protein